MHKKMRAIEREWEKVFETIFLKKYSKIFTEIFKISLKFVEWHENEKVLSEI